MRVHAFVGGTMFKVGDKIRVKKCSPECDCFIERSEILGKIFRIVEIEIGPLWYLGPAGDVEPTFHVDDVFTASHKGLGYLCKVDHMEIFP